MINDNLWSNIYINEYIYLQSIFLSLALIYSELLIIKRVFKFDFRRENINKIKHINFWLSSRYNGKKDKLTEIYFNIESEKNEKECENCTFFRTRIHFCLNYFSGWYLFCLFDLWYQWLICFVFFFCHLDANMWYFFHYFNTLKWNFLVSQSFKLKL